MRIRLVGDDRGATSAEYVLLVVAIAAVVAVVVSAFGGAVKSLFSDSCESIRHGSTSTTCS